MLKRELSSCLLSHFLLSHHSQKQHNSPQELSIWIWSWRYNCTLCCKVEVYTQMKPMSIQSWCSLYSCCIFTSLSVRFISFIETQLETICQLCDVYNALCVLRPALLYCTLLLYRTQSLSNSLHLWTKLLVLKEYSSILQFQGMNNHRTFPTVCQLTGEIIPFTLQ